MKNGNNGRSDNRNYVPYFNPNEAHQTVVNWMQKVEELRIMHNWSDVTTCHNVADRLGGLAKVWYETLPSIAFSWKDFKHKILTNFAEYTDIPSRVRVMLARTKHQNEDMGQYFFEKAALVAGCNFKGKDAAEFIIDGIPNDAIQAASRASNISEVADLRKFLMSYDAPKTRINFRTNPRKPQNDRNHGQRGNSDRSRAWPDRREHQRDQKGEGDTDKKLDAASKEKAISENLCFKCMKKGQFSRDCTQGNNQKPTTSNGSSPWPVLNRMPIPGCSRQRSMASHLMHM